MKPTRLCMLLACASLFAPASTHALSLDDIQFWAGTGTNRAAMVINWSAPEVRNSTTVPNPVAEKSLVWGYRWNGTNTAENMLDAILAADHRLFTVIAPPSQFGTFVYGLGYDLNNNGVFGVRSGTNVFAESSFTNGIVVFDGEDPDSPSSLDPGDLFWSGSYGPLWENWLEQGLIGGFTNAPDRGTNAYWTPDDPQNPYSGHQGQWELAQLGISSTIIHDGSWFGWTVSAGGLDYLNQNDPGTIAFDYHKHAPAPPAVAPTNLPYAAQVIASQGPFGPAPYNDPSCALGAPTTRFYESASKPATRVKLLEAPFNVSIVNGQTNNLIVTMNNGSSLIARFDHPVYDNPVNPYGIDFVVFGNTFYVGSAFGDNANMNTATLTGSAFAEPTKISVSPGATGKPGEDPNDPATWPWYRYDNGPYGDSVFPTQAYKWNRVGTNWTEELEDFSKPVNPALQSRFAAGGLSAADGIDLYDGSGGGTGFDLAPSGFSSIQYIKAEGISPGFSGGEIDAFTIVRPMTVGDSLSMTPDNISNNTATLFFQKPGTESETLLSLNFESVSDIAEVTTARLDDFTTMAPLPGTALNAVQVGLAPILGSGSVAFQTDLALSAGQSYGGKGQDLLVLQETGTNWSLCSFSYNASNHQAVVQNVTNLSAFVVAQIALPQLSLHTGTNGAGLAFTPVAGLPHTLQRSTDLITWTDVMTITPTNAQPITLQDGTAPPSKAFYRLRLQRP